MRKIQLTAKHSAQISNANDKTFKRLISTYVLISEYLLYASVAFTCCLSIIIQYGRMSSQNMTRISIGMIDGGHITCGSLLLKKNQVPCQRNDERMKKLILPKGTQFRSAQPCCRLNWIKPIIYQKTFIDIDSWFVREL